jgi:hypothetical protein
LINLSEEEKQQLHDLTCKDKIKGRQIMRPLILLKANKEMSDPQIMTVPSVTTCLKASQAVTYFSNNMERMRYDRFGPAGYMIGGGTIESA